MPRTVAFGAQAAQSDQPGAAWTPELFMRVKAVGSVRVSPDGQRVVFATSEAVMDGSQSRYRTRVHLADSKGGDSYPLTAGESSCYNPQWSPDGRTVAFLSARSGKTNLWLIQVAGGEARRLTDVATGIASYRWSPDGKAIAFTAPEPPAPEQEKAAREKTDARVIGRDVARHRLFVLTLDGAGRAKGEPRQLTRGIRSVSPSSTPPGFDWSPDGKAIVFSHTKTPRHQDWPTADVSVVDRESGAIKPLATTRAAETSPLYSPDGRWVAYVRSDDPPTWADTNTVCVVPARGGVSRPLADTFDQNPLLVGWSAASDKLYYVETRGTLRKLFALPLDGRPKEIGPASGVIEGVSLNGPRTVAGFTLQRPDRPREAFVSRLDAFRPVQVSRANRHLPDAPLGQTLVIRWRSADRLEVEGLLTRPVGYEKGKRYPLLVSVHGGPEGVFVQDFVGASMADAVPTLAARGYAVLRCNVRGSGGYGKAFRYANYRDWGGKDFQDLMAGVDHVIATGVADPKRLGIFGWSYGGYLSAWAVTQTGRFRAASVGAGMSNLVSLAGTADNVGYLPDYLGGEPWEKFDLYRARSPLFHVDKVRSPVLILHGEEDERVPVSQGYELYNALKRRGCPVEMVVYPRNGHEFHEPKFRLDVMKRNLEWFDRHLRRKGRIKRSGG